jgi:hypothetical protein
VQQHVKYLVVEDESEWASAISARVHSYFETKLRFQKSMVRSETAYDGDQGMERLAIGGFDLVTLDLNLGSGASKSKISGLDLLGAIAERNSAFFVIILTGAVSDPSLEQMYGAKIAALMRVGAMNAAVKSLPAERVHFLNKPTGKEFNTSIEDLGPHLDSALDQYCTVSRERNIFRPCPGDGLLWEVRYNGGPRLTIPSSKSFELIRRALAKPTQELRIIQLVQSMFANKVLVADIEGADSQINAERQDLGDNVEPEDLGDNIEPEDLGDNVEPQDLGDDETDAGLDDDDVGDIRRRATRGRKSSWVDSGFQVTERAPAAVIQDTVNYEVLIGGLLLAREQGLPLEMFVEEFRDRYGAGPLFRIPKRIREYVADRNRAEQQFGRANASNELSKVLLELTPILRGLGVRSITKDGSRRVERVAAGIDTRELALARKHWERAMGSLKEHRLLAEFVGHLESRVLRGPAAKGRIHYWPTGGSESAPFWLTE